MAQCDVCGTLLRPGVAPWHFECRGCDTDRSDFTPSINQGSTDIAPDERARARGLAPVREEGYRRLLARLDELREGRRGSLLEVGSAHAWFLRAARSRFDRLVGIEPDDRVREAPGDPAVEVRVGYFPDKVSAGESFDVVVFNDVFEHIPRTPAVAAAVARALHADGIAVVSLPVREGTIYRVAKFLCRVGIPGPFERLWQKGFPSPHLYYFSHRALVQLFDSVGCKCERVISMPTMRVRGLWARIRYGQPALVRAVATYVCALLAAPVLAASPADVRCFFFRRVRDG